MERVSNYIVDRISGYSKSIRLKQNFKIGAVVGYNCQQLDTVQRNSNIERFRVIFREKTIVLCGSKESIEHAMKLLDIQIYYATNDRWRNVLYKYLDSPDLYMKYDIVYQDDKVLVAHDGMPKAKTHLLIIVKDKSLKKASVLTNAHVELLKHMEEIGNQQIKKLSDNDGSTFMPLHIRANPKMYPLHAHIMTDEFAGHSLRKPRHYNITTTPCSIPLSSVIQRLEDGEPVLGKYSPTQYDAFEYGPMACHKCSAVFGTSVKKLQNHLKTCAKNFDMAKLVENLPKD